MCMHRKQLFLCFKIFENNPFYLDTRDRCQSRLCVSTSHSLLFEFYFWGVEKNRVEGTLSWGVWGPSDSRDRLGHRVEDM